MADPIGSEAGGRADATVIERLGIAMILPPDGSHIILP